jgi:hypothetical protein
MSHNLKPTKIRQPKDGKMLLLSASWKVKEMIELDEIDASAEGTAATAPPPKL